MNKFLYNLINLSCTGITCTKVTSEYRGKYEIKIYFYLDDNPHKTYDSIGTGTTEQDASDNSYDSMYQIVKRLAN